MKFFVFSIQYRSTIWGFKYKKGVPVLFEVNFFPEKQIRKLLQKVVKDLVFPSPKWPLDSFWGSNNSKN